MKRRPVRLLLSLALCLSVACSGVSDSDGILVDSCPPAHDCNESDCMSRCLCEGGTSNACEFACRTRSEVDESLEQRIVQLTNSARAEGGCCGDECFGPAPPLESNVLLGLSAREHAKDMADAGYLSHDSRDGRAPIERMMDAGFEGCAFAENIARGQPRPEAVVRSWLVSPRHCINLLWHEARYLGVGHATSNDEHGDYWVQNFGG